MDFRRLWRCSPPLVQFRGVVSDRPGYILVGVPAFVHHIFAQYTRISGKAGSGKSTLMSYICEDPRTIKSLKTWAGTKGSKLITPKFFFWSPGSVMQKSSVGLLRSLLYQIFQEHPEIAPLPGRHEPLSDWTERRLTKIFQSITSDVLSSYRMCLFIDGLDEFSGDHDALVTMFGDLAQNPNLKAVLSSRPYPKFDTAFGSSAMLKLQDLTRDDIKKFVSDKLHACPRIQSMAAQEPQNVFEGTVPNIIRDIVSKSDGVFLWVGLAVKDQIRGIEEEDSLEQLEERPRILPTTLEDLYAHMLGNIDRVHRKEAAWFLQLALLEEPSTLLDFTLAVYETLDHDLQSSAEFPSQNVINQCQQTRKRISTTCAGLLEVHNETSEPNPTPTPPSLEDIAVTFLHRTVADFLTESEQGRDFLVTNISPDRNIYVMWAKVLVAKVRILGFDRVMDRNIVAIMEAVLDAEFQTGVAQTVVCDYIELAMTILDQQRTAHGSDSHWCTRIFEWASIYGVTTAEKVFSMHQDCAFHSTSNQINEDNFSASIPEKPIDYFGFAASWGLKLFVQQQMKSIPPNHHSRTATYLLCCTLHPPYLSLFGYLLTDRILDLACMLLEYGVDPNMPAFGSTIWVRFLQWMFFMKNDQRDVIVEPKVEAWRTVFNRFVEYGADTNGILCVKCDPRFFDIEEAHLAAFTNGAPRTGEMLRLECFYTFRIEISIPTLIRYCLGASLTSAELLSICVHNGALHHSKCTEISIRIWRSPSYPKKELETWALSDQQSDRFIKAYERYIIPTKPPPSAIVELERQVLLLYDELSIKGPGLNTLRAKEIRGD